jgi:hypothetical protein
MAADVTGARYAFAGLVLDSALPLPELPPAADARPGCTVDLGSPEAAYDRPTGDAVWTIRPAAEGQGFTIDVAGGARFVVAAAGDAVLCVPVAGVAESVVRHLLLDHVLPRVLSLRGALVLHASALRAPDGRAVAFIGPSGAGKSTVAASLVASGWPLLSDDALVVERQGDRPVAVPTYPGLRLWPDAASWLATDPDRPPAGADKLRFDAASFGRAPGFSAAPVPLGRLYFLETDPDLEAPAVTRVSSGEALRELFEGELRLAAADRPSLQRSFDRIGGSGVIPLCRRLSHRRGREGLPAIRRAIEADLAGA